MAILYIISRRQKRETTNREFSLSQNMIKLMANSSKRSSKHNTVNTVVTVQPQNYKKRILLHLLLTSTVSLFLPTSSEGSAHSGQGCAHSFTHQLLWATQPRDPLSRRRSYGTCCRAGSSGEAPASLVSCPTATRIPIYT